MKITFEDYNDKFEPITIYSYEQYRNDLGIIPIEKVRQRDVFERRFLLAYEEDLFKYPANELKQIDLPLTDGLIHVNKLFKPHDFKFGLYFRTNEFLNVFGDVYLARGTVKCTVQTDWGTTNVFPIVMTELDESKTEMVLHNPAVSVDTTQNTKYKYLISNYVVDLVPTPVLYPNGAVYPHVTLDTKVDEEVDIYIANADNVELTFRINIPTEETLTINSIAFNGDDYIFTTLNLDEREWKHNDIVRFDWANEVVTVNDTEYTTPNPWGRLNTGCRVVVDAQTTGTIPDTYEGAIELTVTSSGKYSVVS